jgi:hypothetical protein
VVSAEFVGPFLQQSRPLAATQPAAASSTYVLDINGVHMKNSSRIACVVWAGIGTMLLTQYARNVTQQRQKRVTRKHTQAAVRDWENEGGAIIVAAPHSTAG